MEFLLKMPKKKRKHANPNFTTSSINTIITGLMVLEEFSEIGPILAAAGMCGLAFGFEVNILSEILFLVFYYS
jgi:hypothetical protein